jgi:branched-chain amino acid transport system ATP-binding protein
MGTEANFVENAPLLAAEKLIVGYTRDIDILRDLSCKVWPGRISCVVGANGTGKSTLLKALFGFLKPHSGRVLLSGRDVTGTLPYAMLGLGVAYLPQRPSLFPHLTVESNLKLGLWHARPPKVLARRKLEEAYERFPIAREKRHQPAGQLSGGQQRQVEIARSLMTAPPVYLIDEPTAGIEPRTSEEIYEIIQSLWIRTSRAHSPLLITCMWSRTALSPCKDHATVSAATPTRSSPAGCTPAATRGRLRQASRRYARLGL